LSDVRIVLVYASAPRTVHELSLDVVAGSTLRDALQQAGWLAQWPDIDAASAGTSVWGRRQGPEHFLRDGDRVEVSRPLRVDPKVARRERFVGQGARSTGLFARRRPGSKAGY
jgi:putative ubiquitin-RnfH superfamily antitoxin RatB of RatAB toxin-antitoxin module